MPSQVEAIFLNGMNRLYLTRHYPGLQKITQGAER